MNIFSILPRFLGSILNFINNNIAFGNYGLAIILFTVFVRICILPLTIKQLKSSAASQALQPKIKELQTKYKNDKEQLAKEQMKMYKEMGTSPAAGCLPTLIQLPILWSLYYAIIQPLTNQLGYTAEKVASLNLGSSIYAQLDYAKDSLLNMHFLGFDLGVIPNINFISDPNRVLYLLFPILGGVFSFLSMKAAQLGTKKVRGQQLGGSVPEKDSPAQMMKTMNYTMPLISVFFGFILPAAVSLYWITGYIIQTVQQLLINEYLLVKKKPEIAQDSNVIQGTAVKLDNADPENNMNADKGTKKYRREQNKKYGNKKD